MGQRLSHMIQNRRSSADRSVSKDGTVYNEGPTKNPHTNATHVYNNALVERGEAQNTELLLGGDEVNVATNESAVSAGSRSRRLSSGDEGTLSPSAASIVLVPHQHTLFCERKERVCTAAGKLQELEFLQIQGDISKLKHIIWVKSGSKNGFGAIAIPGSEGRDVYQLCAADIGCFISFHAALAADEMGTDLAHSVFIGPVLAGPARLLELTIRGMHFRVGSVVAADPVYIGGVEGESEYWWLRIKKGKREQISEPKKIDLNDKTYDSCVESFKIQQQCDVDSLLAAASAGSLDPRLYILTDEDEGCELKVKCRPIRSDGIKGEVFTSKASPMISAESSHNSTNNAGKGAIAATADERVESSLRAETHDNEGGILL